MGNPIIKKATSILLFIAMVLSCLTGITPNNVLAATSSKTISFGVSGIASPKSPSGTNAWAGEYVYFGSFNNEPVKWRILDPSGTGEKGNSSITDGILLQANNTLKDNAGEILKQYNAVSGWLNGTEAGNFLNSFTTEECNALLSDTKAATKDCPASSFLKKADLSNTKVFLLDAGDLATNDYGYQHTASSSNSNIQTDNLWWLRSTYKSNRTGVQGCVLPGGMAFYSFDDEDGAIVPAINVDKSKILFTSSVDFDKSGDFGAVSETDSSAWKFTLLDPGYQTTAATGTGDFKGVTRREDGSNSIITVPYSANVPGACQLTLMITNGDYQTGGSILYYGKVKDLTEGGTQSGDVTFTLPADYDESKHKAYLFTENVNDDYATDYAGTPASFVIPPKHIHSWDTNNWEHDTIGHWHKCTNEITPCDITDNSKKKDYATHTKIKFLVNTPDCQTKAEYHYECKTCGTLLETETGALGDHNWVTDTPVAATCTSEGYTTHTCTICKKQERISTTPKVEHSWGAWVITTAPTCTAAGTSTKTCSVCGAKETKTENALGHDWSAFAVTTPPTCTEDGISTRTCKRCNIKETETVPSQGHIWDEGIVLSEPTCEEDGEAEYTCTVCQTTEKVPIDALGHDWEVIDERESTCELAPNKALGYCTSKCSVCGVEETEYEEDYEECDIGEDEDGDIPEGSLVVVKEPTCTEPGQYKWKCYWCHTWYPEEGDEPLGHDFGPWQVVKAPTGTEPGLQQRICKTCGEADQAEIPKHNYVSSVTKNPSCVSEGITTYTCKDCGDTYTEKIPILNHNFGKWTVTVVPTEDTPGQEQRTCVMCGKAETRKTAAAKHKHYYPVDEWHSDKTEHWHQCSCGQERDSDTHNWDTGFVIVTPTEKETGTIQYTCEQCGYQITQKLPHLVTTLVSGNYEYEFSEIVNNKPMVTIFGFAKNKSSKTVKIPKTITIDRVTYTVNKVGYKAFDRKKQITRIVIPNTVTEIEEYAFANNTNVKSVVLGTHVRTIKKHAFRNLRSLKTFTIKGKKLKAAGIDFFQETNDFTIYVPKDMKKTYTKMFAKHKKHKIKVKK